MNLFNKPVAMLCMVFAATVAHAEEAALDFNIPPQPVNQVLDALGKQTGLQFVYADHNLHGIDSPGVKGRYALREAVAKALAGTGLAFQFTADKTVAIKPGAVASKPGVEPAELAPVTVTATRTERRVDQVPANVSVITAKDISRRNVDKVQDVLRTVESVEVGNQFSVANSSDIDIRGVGMSGTFIPTSKVLVDGVGTDSIVSIVQGHGGMNFLSPWDVEQVDVVRGPASALYGPEVIGGVVNLIPKRWKGDPGVEVHAAYGTHNTAKLGAAIGNASDSGDFRLSVYNAKSDGFIAQTYPDTPGFGISVDLAPRNWTDRKVAFSGGVRLSDHQELTASYQDFATRSFTQGGHRNQYLNMDGNTWMFGYRHDFGETATLKASYRETRLKHQYATDNEYWGTPGDLALAFKGGKFGDSSELNLQGDWHLSASNLLIAGYNRITGVGTLNSLFGSVFINKSTVDGFYLQDEARFGRWNFTVGGRQDRIRLYDDTTNGVLTNPASSVSVFNPRLGVQYQWTDAASLYASAGTAYVPATNELRFGDGVLTIANPGLRPEKSTTYEIGLRSKLAYGDLKLAAFQTEYKDKIIRFKVNATQNQGQNADRVVVNGVELGWNGKLGAAWTPFLNYSYTDSRIKANTLKPQNIGTRISWTSVHKLNLGVTYAPTDAWSASLQGSYHSDQFLELFNCRNGGVQYNNTNTFACHLGGYFTADAKVTASLPFGGKDKWDAWLAVNNLTGKRFRQHYWFDVSDGRTMTLGIDGKF